MSDACERIFTEILESESLVNIKGLPREAKYYIIDRLIDLMIKLTKLSVKEVLEVQSLAISYLEIYLGDREVLNSYRVYDKGVDLASLVTSCIVLAFNLLGLSTTKSLLFRLE